MLTPGQNDKSVDVMAQVTNDPLVFLNIPITDISDDLLDRLDHGPLASYAFSKKIPTEKRNGNQLRALIKEKRDRTIAERGAKSAQKAGDGADATPKKSITSSDGGSLVGEKAKNNGIPKEVDIDGKVKEGDGSSITDGGKASVDPPGSAGDAVKTVKSTDPPAKEPAKRSNPVNTCWLSSLQY